MIVRLAEAVLRLARSELVAYPTDTLYGLGADAFSAEALARLRALKGREAERGLSVLIADLAALERFASPRKKILQYPGSVHTLEFEPNPDLWRKDVLAWLDSFH